MVILVDTEDNAIGEMEKMEAHEKGVLHRAFSVLIFDKQGNMLLQKRAKSKYHSGGLWTNACCSHPLPNELSEKAAKRRLMEEMGIDADPSFVFKFIYKAELDNNLTEHEYDHVFTTIYSEEPKVNPEEVEDWKYVSIEELKNDINENPEHYTAWFKIILKKMDDQLEKQL